MAETNRLSLPLIAPSQAQKHVTVNEALARLDALTQITLTSVGDAVPPTAPEEGDVHAVGLGAEGVWAGQDGALAVFLNNGWAFVAPRPGWRGWSAGAGTSVTFDGADWVAGAGALTANGAGFVHRSVELEHALSAGATSVVSGALPADAIVYGVTGRVLSDIGGVGTIALGVSGSADRYGSGFGPAAGSWLRGLTGSPLTYYSATDLVLTASGGPFDGTGVIRLAVHFAELTLPRG